MQRTPSLLSLPDPLWPVVVSLDRVLSMGQIELFHIETEHKQTSAHLTVFKQPTEV